MSKAKATHNEFGHAYINLQNPIRRASPFKVQNKMFLPSGDHSTKANCVFTSKVGDVFSHWGLQYLLVFFYMSSSLRETNILSTKSHFMSIAALSVCVSEEQASFPHNLH